MLAVKALGKCKSVDCKASLEICVECQGISWQAICRDWFTRPIISYLYYTKLPKYAPHSFMSGGESFNVQFPCVYIIETHYPHCMHAVPYIIHKNEAKAKIQDQK